LVMGKMVGIKVGSRGFEPLTSAPLILDFNY